MNDITKFKFEKIFNAERLVTLFYMEISKDFQYDGESHDFWEMVYIDKGQMLCTADKNVFLLKSGELTFHKPNEFHNLKGNGSVAPNVTILTFECHSREMKFFEGKIFKLDEEEKSIFSFLVSEGISRFKIQNKHNPLQPVINEEADSPLGSSQMTKNLLEIFLIMLRRNTEMLSKKTRKRFSIDRGKISYAQKELFDYIDSQLYGKLTIADVACALGKSESTVKKLFATYMSGGIINYYNGRKIDEAKRLIREDKYNFNQISDMLCFDTPQYFSKIFKQYTNMTPREYKLSILTQ